MGKPTRKTISAETDESLNPDLDLKIAIRQRTKKLLQSAIGSVMKLTEETAISSLRVLKNDLESKWSDYIRAFEQEEAIVVATADGSLDEITTEYISMHNSYLKAQMMVAGLMASQMNDSTHDPQNSRGASLNGEHRPKFKMAPMRISPFSGDLVGWIEFKATCDTILDSSFPEVQRLQYLKDALFGEARLLVSHILPGPGSFQCAMKLLEKRYENQRAIINAHLKHFYAIPCIETPTADSFRSILNSVNGLVAALNCYEIDTTSWNAILVFHISQRFDKSTLSLWEEKLDGKRAVPKLSTLLDFLQVRITVLETTEAFTAVAQQPERLTKPQKFPTAHKQINDQRNYMDKHHDKLKAFFTLKEDYKCGMCDKNHLASRCTEIGRMHLKDRQARVRKNGLCENCLYPHRVVDCPFKPACKKCEAPHHTLLHIDNNQMFLNMNSNNEPQMDDQKSVAAQPIQENSTIEDDQLSVLSAQYFYHLSEVLEDTILATALVPTRFNGRSVLAKGFIDMGSTTNLISIRTCRLLQLHVIRSHSSMTGVGNSPVGKILGATTFEIGSVYDKQYKLTLRAIVVQSIGTTKGYTQAEIKQWTHLAGLQLADPNYYQAHKIDILLGGSAHADFILPQLIKGDRHQPIAQNTKLGWIVSGNGSIGSNQTPNHDNVNLISVFDSNVELTQQLKSFWELEEAVQKKIVSKEEQQAEEMFASSVKRVDNGKFIVDLPFKKNPFENLGESITAARRRYGALQRRFDKNPSLKMQYDAVLEEYLTLGHMELVTNSPPFQCFLPHHAITKESSTTTKVRTVFDASAKTSSGLSLNDCLCVGPVIQPELFDLLSSWRKFEFAV